MYFAKRFLFLQTLLHFLLQFGTSSLDAITTSQNIKDGGEFLVSTQKTFAFGFFTPGESTHRYVGIWYYSAPEKTVVWVANRDTPLKDKNGVLSIDVLGNLVLHADNQSSTPIWSTNHVSKPSNHNTLAQLKDSGNLVLMSENGTGEVLWESFDYPTHIQLPEMKIGIDRKTGLKRFLTSWKSRDDPGTGNWSYKIHTNGFPQLFLYNGDIPRWRSNYWTDVGWSSVPKLASHLLFSFSLVDNQRETTITWSPIANQVILSKIVLNESGWIQRSVLFQGQNKWTPLGSVPYADGCDTYGECGAFGNCDVNAANDSKCSCLPGFLRNALGGCARKQGEASLCWSGKAFKKVVGVKVPDTSVARVDVSVSFGACEELCLKNCSCLAYASLDVSQEGGCITWHGVLVDTRTFKEGGQDLYVRVDALELVSASTLKKSKGYFFANKRRLAIVVVAILFTSFLLLLFSSWLIKRKSKESRRQVALFNDGTNSSQSFPQDSAKLDEIGRKPDVQFFDLSTIIVATDNFSPSKRLGQGGFGPVYKVSFLHTLNLNIYQYYYVIFSTTAQEVWENLRDRFSQSNAPHEIRRKLLDWRKRFDIISGIARGVLYLHQDSRLKIIHRDLKASNVLLDEAMNPKISDFGLARMFGDDQDEASTRKVVGTYGYMSPEYAMEGLYSIKSDVFSYGVLILEIISGKRNNYYHIGSPSLSLIGYVWDLWMDGKALDIVDPSLGQEYPTHEVLRCIQIGLLCVQEQAIDRPTMLEIVFMLGNEATIPSPNKPPFINRTINSGLDSSGSKGPPASSNKLTITMPEGR
ncbi:G-type lectin S-receptor-like serine/threonine-protein kinase At1g11410 [Corylus avellana]|uniref:G-type lectin S-receptor-like serine/threonine-protein kinase At1g11410 n=1 Tax=Corylus avellana TaxID=13451 RepID=UPI00286A39B2|nr:G-type lectin S-receptor-like serine/threonine-protein kinase At1g11410 [Corylus avellana]